MCENLKPLFMRKLPTGDELDKLAEKLGVSTYGLRPQQGSIRGPLNEAELQRRVMEALAWRRQSSFWIVSVISALASVCSAIAAWVAAYR